MTTSKAVAWEPVTAQAIIDELKCKPGALLPILHAIQDRFSYVPEEAVSLIAQALKLTRAEVHGVISFYHHFRTQSTRPTCCRDLPCRSLSSARIPLTRSTR